MKPALKKWLLAPSILTGLQFLFATTLHAETWTQIGVGPFTWNDPANWTPAAVPNAASAVADFTTGGGPATQEVTLDAAIAVGTLNLTNTVTSYTVSNGAGGSFTLNNGGPLAIVTLNTGALTQTVNADITLTAGVNITNGNAIGGDALTIGGNITGTGPLVKLGTGNLVLSGTNSYSGDTYFGPSTGTGAINAGKITLSGGNDRLPTTSVLNFHPVTYSATNNTIYTSTLDIGSTSQTFSTIHLPGAGVVGGSVTVSQLPTGANVTIAGSGGTLTLNGESFYVGIANNTNGLTPAAGITHTVSMSGLTNFVFDNPSKEVGVHLSGNRVNSQTTIVGTLTLAPNSTIKAANLLVGDLGPAGVAGGGRSILNLGNGNTVLNIGSSAATGRINVGYSTRSNADMVLAAGGNLSIRGFGGGSTPLPEFLVGLIANSNDPRVFTDVVNFGAGSVNAIVTKLDVGTADNSSGGRGGVTNSSFTLGATSGPEGFTVGTLNIGRITGGGGAVVNILTANGTFTMNNAAGTLNAATINLAENTIADGTSTPAKTVTGTLNLQDGTIKATTIQLGTQGGGANTVTPRLNWTAGTIENTAGSDLAINNVPITLLTAGVRNFNTTGSNSIIQNAASPIGGATFGLNKTGTGSLILNATNTYTGPTTVSQGTLGGNGTLASVVSLHGGSTISPGASAGTFTIGGLTINDNSSSNFELNAADTTIGGGINDLIDINGLLDVASANASAVTVNVLKIGGGNFDGIGTWTLMTYDALNPGLFDPANIVITGIESGYTGTIIVVPDTANPLLAGKVQLNVVPEASSFLLTTIGLIGACFVRYRRKKLS